MLTRKKDIYDKALHALAASIAVVVGLAGGIRGVNEIIANEINSSSTVSSGTVPIAKTLDFSEMRTNPDLYTFAEKEIRPAGYNKYSHILTNVIEKGYLQDVEDPVSLLTALLWVESSLEHYNPDGTVKRGDSGEIGIGQIMPSTTLDYPDLNVWTLEGNIEFASRYLDYNLGRCNNLSEALTAYNSGRCNYKNDYADRVMERLFWLQSFR